MILNFDSISKNTNDFVRPGVFDVLANLDFVREFIREDLPTFDH